jgi:hypothetical protein
LSVIRAITLSTISSTASSEIGADPPGDGERRRPCSAERRAANASASEGTARAPGKDDAAGDGATGGGVAIVGACGRAGAGRSMTTGGGVWTATESSALGRGVETTVGAGETGGGDCGRSSTCVGGVDAPSGAAEGGG